jgi:MFS transporter, ACS family, solute carrier family 17 (sodium-dependent inorganic phosphate cotransporter), member 5
MQRRYGWSEATKGLVLSSFFWGYVPGQVPGGLAAQRFGGARVFCAGILATSLLTLAVPLCARSLPALYALRALMGLGEAVTFPAANALFTQWFPAGERAALVAFSSSGAFLGTAFAFPISGEIVGLARDNATFVDSKGVTRVGLSTSWPWAFNVFGALGCGWAAAFALLGASSPEQSRGISAAELALIQRTRGQDADQVLEKEVVARSPSPPWRAFLTHRAAWALYFNHAAACWGGYTLMTFLPDFMDRQLGFDIQSSGGLALLPYLLMFLAASGAGALSDRLVHRMPVRRVRVLVQCSSYCLAGAFLLLAGYVENTTAAVVFVTLSIGVSGASMASNNVNYLDISPHYAGQLFSIGNTIGNIAGIITPIVTGQILGDKSSATKERWQLVFIIGAAFYFTASVVWVLFVSGKPVAALN